MIKFIDILQGLQTGDEGKGAVAYSLCKKSEYDICMRVGGGSNAGHTIYHNGKKFVTHQVPTGIFHGKICIIGNGCVVNLSKLEQEIQDLEAAGIQVKGKLFIANNAHIVMLNHVTEELNESKIGTTKQGIGPCYRDKYARKGIRFENLNTKFVTIDTPDDTYNKVINKDGEDDFASFEEMKIDLYDFLFKNAKEYGILVEGAQGFYLDIDHGDYPYVTSSHASVAGALLNCLPFTKIRKIYGVIKAYETYVGAREFQPKDPIFNKLGDLGMEYGATTGRRRQCNWLDISRLIKAININCVNRLIVCKMDILKQLNDEENNQYWKILESLDNKVTMWLEHSIENEENFKIFLENNVITKTQYLRLDDFQYKYGPDEDINI